MDDAHPFELIGERFGDPADVKACVSSNSFVAFGPGLHAYDWEAPCRVIPSPPQVEIGPLTELRLSPSPAAAIAAMVVRRRASSRQSILDVLKDARQAAIYRVRAPGVRIKDGRSDARLVGGIVDLRREGEQAQERLGDRALVAAGPAGGSDQDAAARSSATWEAIADGFDEMVAAIEMPDDAIHPTLKLDWTLVAAAERLDNLRENHLFKLDFVGQSCVTRRDLLNIEDIAGKPAGRHFAYYLAREAAYDFISISRKSGASDWLRFSTAIVGFMSSIGGLGWILSKVL